MEFENFSSVKAKTRRSTPALPKIVQFVSSKQFAAEHPIPLLPFESGRDKDAPPLAS
jgi:hypothetical protein